MNDPKLDQATAFVAEMLPPLWRRLYENLRVEKFTSKQAFELVKMYIFANGTGDRRMDQPGE